ncbi:MAG TPA: phosphopyruvate hydratase [Candidatus Sulfotelmatobacter sp.]|nr:phosphopyruvate hydratase [Candidatus Sulfotelmatobacter sp.]
MNVPRLLPASEATSVADIRAMEILDSRGNPTLEVEVELAGGAVGRALVPSGASTGRHEAVELRDADPDRYGGRGVLRAVANVNDVIAPVLRGADAADQVAIDEELRVLDGTATKERLGSNAIVGTSLACAHAAAAALGVPLYRYLAGADGDAVLHLPVPLLNVLNGGVHARTSVDLQEFMVVPHGFGSLAEAVRAGSECFRALREVLELRGLQTGQGDEGGFAPNLHSNEEAVEIILAAVERAGYVPGGEVSLALDPAASELYEDGAYHLHGEGRVLDSAQLVDEWSRWCDSYPIISIEDGMAEDDWEGWKLLTERLGERIQLVGDDLFVTSVVRLREGVARGVANALLVKTNQVGTLTETREAIALAQASGLATVISHRSGETEDTTIADLAVAVDATQIKAGAPSRSERVAKYNRLLRIERELGKQGRFWGKKAFPVLASAELDDSVDGGGLSG